VAADVAQLIEGPRERLGHDVIATHRVTDLHWAAGQLVDLGRLARKAPPVCDFKVAERHQAFQVLKGD